jgi:hypothetical protein
LATDGISSISLSTSWFGFKAGEVWQQEAGMRHFARVSFSDRLNHTASVFQVCFFPQMFLDI